MIYDYTELKEQFEEEYVSNSAAALNWQFFLCNTWQSFISEDKLCWYNFIRYRRNPEALPACTTNNKRHKYYDILIAFAEGKTILYNSEVIQPNRVLSFINSDKVVEFLTVAPDVKPDTVVKTYIDTKGNSCLNTSPNAKFTFDGQTGKLKKVELA